MARIRLKRLIGKQKEATAVVNNFIIGIDTPLAITDAEGQLLLGVADDTLTNKHPITLDGEILGWVAGAEQPTTALATLISYLAEKEAEKKTLASEVLDRYREINLLYNIAEKLATTLQLEAVAHLTIEEANRLINGSSSAVMLFHEHTQTLNTIASFGQKIWNKKFIKSGQDIIDDVALTGKAEIVNDVPADTRFRSDSHQLKSLVCAPLKTKQRVIGVIFIGNQEPITYTASDLKLLTTLALQAAPAIENALLYEDKLKEARELEEKNSALEQLDKFKDEFLANTSHELRTPLNGIIGLAESMLDGATGLVTSEQKHNLGMIVASGRRLANLVNDILDFSKMKHYELELDIVAVDMKMLTDIVLALSKPLVNEKLVSLKNEIDDHIPPVAGDKNRLQQIMHNLVGNAIKFTEQGSVTLSALEQNGMVEITVTDTGIGIPAHKLEDIFKSFEQVDASTERTYSGTGLGLSITKQLVELHGGKVWVESQESQGSRFTFSLPVSPKALRALMVDSNEKLLRVRTYIEPQVVTNSKVMEEDGSFFTVLIVDDEAVNRQVLVNQLSLHNYIVIQAVNGPEALEIIKNIKPDLVLLDVMMPKMSGYEVCQKIRERYPAAELPVVMLTAKNQVMDLVAGFEAGANDYLPKPFSKNELLARIQTHLRLARVNTSYARFVPYEILHFLGKESIVDVKLGDQVEGEMTLLFADIRSFTSLSEKMSPKESFDFINDLLGEVGPIIRKSNGFIDKYIGDAMMAIFPERADDAVRAAIAIRRQLASHNARRAKRQQIPIEVGIGIHSGKLMLGTIGEAQRMEGTVISDAVNTAARLEGLTKRYGVNIIISGDTLSRLENSNGYHHRILDRVKVKGRHQPISLYGIFDGDPPEQIDLRRQTQPEFEEGWSDYYAQLFSEAQHHFHRVLEQDPHDKAAQLYLERSTRFMTQEGPIELVESLTEK